MTTSTLTPATPLTAAEFFSTYGGDRTVELVKGKVVRCPMPGFKHGEVSLTVGSLVRDFVKQRNLGRVLSNDTFVRTGSDPDSYRGADVCYVSYANLPKEVESPDGPVDLPPDLVVEVRSPSDRLNRLTAKATEYLDAGVTVVIVVDPTTESAAVYRVNEFPMRYSNGDELTVPDVLPGFAVPVKKFFS